MYNDPNGEFVFAIFAALPAFWGAVATGAVIGAAVGLASYTIGLAVTGNLHQWKLGGALKATFFGAVGGAVSAGLGELFQSAKVVAALGKAKFAVQAAAHGISQGILSVMQGGDFISGLAGGFFGSVGADLWGGAMKGLGYEKFAGSTMGMVSFGALSGGIGAELSGGNFWQGAVTGGIVAGLNHVAHMEKVVQDPPKEFNLKDFLLDLFTGGEASQIKRTFSNKSINDEKVALQVAVVILSEYYANQGSRYLGRVRVKTPKFPKGLIKSSSKKGGGTVYKDPNNQHNVIRYMPGNLDSPNPAQREPYIKYSKAGVFYDVNGKKVSSGSAPEAHIPASKFDISKMPKF